ncbi:MAG: hypothetical protein IJH64_01940 [Oscillospiraceae bacterium]|nr:hypothetical protein [Oscillospiraceae bacterium]
MLIATFLDGTQYEVLDNTTVYPSGSPMIRSHMELHMAEDAMTIEEFETLLSDENKTRTITFTMINDETEEVIFQNTYSYYVVLAEVGKKIVETVSTETGQTLKEKHLVARLEQLTDTEQQLRDLEIVDILLGREE